MKDDRAYLLHIRDCVERILEYTRGGRKAFLDDRKTQDAVLRNLEVIGEAVKGLSDSLKAGQRTIPWKRVAGMRDVLIHHYFGVNLDTVWEVVEEHVPALREAVERMLGQED